MKKFLISVLMVLGFMPLVIAQDVTFCIVRTDGSTESYPMNTDTRIYYSDTQLFVYNPNSGTYTHDLSSLRKAYFVTNDDVNEVGSQSLAIYPNPVKDIMKINGIADGQQITVYTLNGQVMMRLTASGEATVDVSGLQNGIYLISAGNQVAKFIKM